MGSFSICNLTWYSKCFMPGISLVALLYTYSRATMCLFFCFFIWIPHTVCIFQLASNKCFIYSRRKVGNELSRYCKVLRIRPDIELGLLILLLMCLSNSKVLSKHIPKSFSSLQVQLYNYFFAMRNWNKKGCFASQKE